jgi:formylglycine-generating enzyme required for sulfatase activity/HEAT repeat protein
MSQKMTTIIVSANWREKDCANLKKFDKLLTKKGYVMGFKKIIKDILRPGWKHPDPAMRLRTVHRMTAPAVLADVYKNDSDYTVRKATVERMTAQKILSEIVKNETDAIIRLIAVWKIKDINLLKEIAQNDQDDDVRQAATWKSTNPGIAQQAKDAASYADRKTGILGLSPKDISELSDQLLLKDIAIHDQDASLRANAVNKISSQAILTDIIKKSRDLNTREAAVSQITDQELLQDIAKYRHAAKRAKLYFKLQIAIVTMIALAVIGLMVLHRTSVSNSKRDLFAWQNEKRDDAYNYLIQDKKSLIAFLLVKVDSPDYNTVDRSLAYLKRLKPNIHELVPALLKALPGKDNAIKKKIGATIEEMGPPAIPALLQELENQNPDIRTCTATLLEELGPKATPAVPALITKLGSRDKHNQYALEILVKIGKPAVPALITKLNTAREKVKIDVAQILGKIGPEAKAAVPALIKMLGDWDPSVKKNAAEALGRIGPHAKTAVPALIKALRDHSSVVRRAAVEALGKIGPEAKTVVPALIKSLGDKNAKIRQAAVEALGKIGPDAKAVVPALIKSLDDKNEDVRRAAVVALGKIGQDAKTVIPALIKSLDDKNKNVRKATLESLAGIGKSAINEQTIQTVLTNVTKSAKYADVRVAAVKKLTNQAALADVAKNAKYSIVREDAVKLLTNQKALADLAKNANNSAICKAAVKKLTSRTILVNVAKSARDYSIRKAVYLRLTKGDLAKLNKKSYLTDIAKNEKKYSVRKVVYLRMTKNNLAKLTNQAYLTDVAKKDEKIEERKAAVKKLTNQEVLTNIAKNDKDIEVRKAAVKKLTNQEVLADIAKNDKDIEIRKAAVKKLTNQEVLAGIAKNDKDYSVRKVVYQRITSDDLSKLNNQKYLADIAKNDKDESVRKVIFTTSGGDLTPVVNARYALLTGLASGSDSAQKLQKQWVSDFRYALEIKTKKAGIILRLIPPGKFTMGSPSSEVKGRKNETQHDVALTQPFYCGKFEVTQEQWRLVLGNNPSFFRKSRDNVPVDRVSWDDCQTFLSKLCELENVNPGTYRLLSEAQWEYACRAGTRTAFYYGDSLDSSQANFDGNYPYNASEGTYREKTIPVGNFKPNAFGLYDMHGNVWEWCNDRYGTYPDGRETDPTGAASGSRGVYRGGGWDSYAEYCRSANRGRFAPSFRSSFLGFRLLRIAPVFNEK